MSLKAVLGQIRQLLFAPLRHFRKRRGANTDESDASSRAIVLQFTAHGLAPGESVQRLLAEQLRRMDERLPVPQDEAADAEVSGKDVRLIDLDATNWKSIADFYDALLAALGAPKGHGRSVDALIDSMVWGGMNEVDPPYTIRIFGAAKLPKDVRDHIELTQQAFTRACAEFRCRKGRDVVIRFETYP